MIATDFGPNIALSIGRCSDTTASAELLVPALAFMIPARIPKPQQNIDRFVHSRITCELSKQIVAICGDLKARRRLQNKGTFATNSNVFA
jgi:hypothetical protein